MHVQIMNSYCQSHSVEISQISQTAAQPIVDNIERFGAHAKYCAQRPESLLIPVAQNPGRRAQKRHQGVAYKMQAAQGRSYSIIIDTMYFRLWYHTANGPRHK
jgi:hypothetical protein